MTLAVDQCRRNAEPEIFVVAARPLASANYIPSVLISSVFIPLSFAWIDSLLLVKASHSCLFTVLSYLTPTDRTSHMTGIYRFTPSQNDVAVS